MLDAYSSRGACGGGGGRSNEPSESRARHGGFTLIELLVVIAIIAILAAILFPVFMQAKMASRKVGCFSNMKQISMGYGGYLDDYNFYPSVATGANLFLIDPYIKQKRFKYQGGAKWANSIWLCPGAPRDCFYAVANSYWAAQKPPAQPPWDESKYKVIDVFTSYCVNDDVTCYGRGTLSDVVHPTRTVLLGESVFIPPPGLDANGSTTKTACFPTSKPGSVSGWFDPTDPEVGGLAWSYFECRHPTGLNGGSNFLWVDGHVTYRTQFPPMENWVVPGWKEHLKRF